MQPVVRKSTDYSAEERANFPRLVCFIQFFLDSTVGFQVRFNDDHFVDWEETIADPGRHVKPGPGKNN